MKRIEKTVFISYRRADAPWALTIYQWLKSHGYDVFFDFEGIASGSFADVILENIRARAHFLALLTPTALDRCDVPGDWLRREIEEAMVTRRNIVPIMLDGFSFGADATKAKLTGHLTGLSGYNGLAVAPSMFDDAMSKLDARFLNVERDSVIHPASVRAMEVAEHQQNAANVAIAGEIRRAERFALTTAQRIEEMTCPYCDSPLASLTFTRALRDVDDARSPDEQEVMEFVCGYAVVNRRGVRPCSKPSENNKSVMVNVPVAITLRVSSAEAAPVFDPATQTFKSADSSRDGTT
jgi:sarcosine oxidase delta subunit